MKMKKLGLVLAAAAMVAFAGGAMAQNNSGPSSKANFTYADVNITQEIDITALDIWVESIDSGPHAGGDGDGECEGAIFGNEGADDINGDPIDEYLAGSCEQLDKKDALAHSKWKVLQTQIKMPKHKDISIDVSFECGNFLDTTVKSKGGAKDSASAASTVRVAVLVDDGVNGTRAALPSTPSALGADLTGDGNADGDDDVIAVLSSGVVFCHKSQLLEAKFQGLIQDGEPFNLWEVTTDYGEEDVLGTLWADEISCEASGDADGSTTFNVCTETTIEVVGTCLLQLEDGQIVLDTDCLTPEELRLVTGSMTANSFNFLYHNADESSVHTITVIAWLDTGAALGGTTFGDAGAKAAIGLGSMMVETVRLVKQSDADLMSGAAICVDISGDEAVVDPDICP